jgi:hypothetical protein
MTRALGFRAEPSRIHWAVVEGSRQAPILLAHDRAAAPVDFDEAPALSWYRTRVKQIIEMYKPAAVTIWTAESIARGGNTVGARRRLRIEGVLLETADSCGLSATIGALAAISSKLGTPAKKYINADDFRGLDLSTLPAQRREAILVAVAGLP